MSYDLNETSRAREDPLAEHEAEEMQLLRKIHKKVKKMAMVETPSMIMGTGGNDGAGLGLGGGLIGGVLLGALLGRNGGLFGGGNTDGAAAVGLQSSIDTNTILQSLGDIKASVPLAEAQVQLALAGQSANLNNQINAANIANLEGQGSIRANISLQTQALTEQIAAVGNQADRNLFQISQTIINDGEKTRALITSNQISELQRLAAERQDEIIELRAERNRESDRHGIEINMINNQNQNQLQFQQQAQVLNTLANALVDVSQVARATNQAINIGSGRQEANPTNSATNVRA